MSTEKRKDNTMKTKLGRNMFTVPKKIAVQNGKGNNIKHESKIFFSK